MQEFVTFCFRFDKRVRLLLAGGKLGRDAGELADRPLGAQPYLSRGSERLHLVP